MQTLRGLSRSPALALARHKPAIKATAVETVKRRKYRISSLLTALIANCVKRRVCVEYSFDEASNHVLRNYYQLRPTLQARDTVAAMARKAKVAARVVGDRRRHLPSLSRAANIRGAASDLCAGILSSAPFFQRACDETSNFNRTRQHGHRPAGSPRPPGTARHVARAPQVESPNLVFRPRCVRLRLAAWAAGGNLSRDGRVVRRPSDGGEPRPPIRTADLATAGRPARRAP